MEDIEFYKKFGTGTNNSQEIQAVAKLLTKDQVDKDITQVFLRVRQYINDACYDKSSGEPLPKRSATNLLESRRAKASELIGDCLASCGSMSTLATSLLRAMGYAVKLIHGTHPSSEHHAWIEIYDMNDNTWSAFDLTGYGDKNTGRIGSSHIKIIECADWYDIKDFLIGEHKKWTARQTNAKNKP